MTSVYIAVGIVVVLILMVCYAFMIQTVTKKREQQQRLTSALETRVKNFRYLLSGFPEGFLPRDLHLLVYRHLVDSAQQLTSLCPKQPKYVQELELFSREMSDLQRKPPTNRRVRLDSTKQNKEVKHYLSELNKFVHRLHQRGKLDKAEFEAYSAEIRQLVLHIAVDSYNAHAGAAETADKPRMALHYYTLARNLLSKEKLSQNYKRQINDLNRQIIRLEAIVGTTAEAMQTNEAEGVKDKAWDGFESDDSWKKKALYD
ncbi:hypothetical protein [Halioxenophilus sp. WMMB6]|uniref:hypothetical protein n=1 Tax=Halioxenophilus sp. WMMB6 TaxID=3073815 RepID=UPI00295E5456|nr:hypothetical protein [Halioxenophilus sp. WMMB6]